MGRDDYEGRSTAWDQNSPNNPINNYAPVGTNVEMEPLTGTGNSFPHREDPNAILNECRKIDDEIKEMKSVVFRRIQSLQSNILNSTGDNSLQRELDEANAELMSMYRNLTGRVKRIKQKPESGSPRNAPQVGKIDRDLKDTHKQYLSIEAEFSRKMREQSARQYRIVRPDATEAEVQQAVDNPQQQMFSQALMQSNRQGQAQSTLNAVTARHQEIEKIAQQMKELAQLFEDMDNLVVQQEAAVTNIEMKGEEVVDNMDKGTEQIGVAIKSARNARKWKWWCLGICGRCLNVEGCKALLLIYCSSHRYYHRCCGSHLQVRHPDSCQGHHRHCEEICALRVGPCPKAHIWPCGRSGRRFQTILEVGRTRSRICSRIAEI